MSLSRRGLCCGILGGRNRLAMQVGSDCGGHGIPDASGAGCECDRYWFGDHCQTDFVAAAGIAPWTALVVLACLGHACFIVSAILRLVDRRRETGVFFPSCSARDVAAWMNLLASCMRLLWFTPIASGANAGNRIIDGLLLRMPQSAWVSGYLCVILMWRDIAASADGRRSGGFWPIVVVVALSAVLMLSTGAITVVDGAMDGGFGGHTQLRVSGDVVFTVFVVGLACFGARASHRLRVIAKDVEASVHELRTEERYRAFLILGKLREAHRMTLVSLTTAVMLVVCLAIISISGSSPSSDPQAYLAYMFVVHVCVELSAGGVLLVVTRQDSVRAPSARGRVSNPTGHPPFVAQERSALLSSASP